MKKVWTKLRKGLYGLRRATTARRCPPSPPPEGSRPGKKGSRDEETSVSTKHSIFNSNSTATTNDKKIYYTTVVR